MDRSIKPKSSNIVIADVDGEWMGERLMYQPGVSYQKAGVMLSELAQKKVSRQTCLHTHQAGTSQAG
ncbi:hypothetical protein [Nitrosospira sp. Is2]|uniref:hypothetical protein n=1 Tax=Nitrosospira sp. Is2 TaxID=3080532 RepID=UPI002954A44E|nr:hypothetical protein [Nitrosospira sp. Is2]WON75126.1 hypothetical protein R5L00_06510 [Nitrosospira sp. Is2]